MKPVYFYVTGDETGERIPRDGTLLHRDFIEYFSFRRYLLLIIQMIRRVNHFFRSDYRTEVLSALENYADLKCIITKAELTHILITLNDQIDNLRQQETIHSSNLYVAIITGTALEHLIYYVRSYEESAVRGTWHLEAFSHIAECVISAEGNGTNNSSSLRDKINEARKYHNNVLFPLFVEIPDWQKSWHTSNTVALAKAIYEGQAWNRSPVLADALMDAGCEHEEVIDILKNHHQHFARGVWVIDKLCGYN